MIALLLLSLLQEAAPWRTDVVVAREEALKQSKPVIILLGLDSPLDGVKDLKGTLAKFAGMVECCKKDIVLGLTNDHEANDALRKEFGTWPRFPWIVVLDGKGERLGVAAIHKITGRWGPRSADLFPELICGQIRGFLMRKESLPALEKRWAAAPTDEALLDELTYHYAENLENGRLAELYDRAAGVEAYRKDVRESFRIKAFYARCESGTGLDVSPDRGAALFEEVGRLLCASPDHPLLTGAHRMLVNSSDIREVFDLPGKREALVEKLNVLLASRSNREPVEYQVANIQKSLQWLVDGSVRRRDAPPGDENVELERAKGLARLGDAKATVEFFSKAPHDQYPVYQAWVREAKAKLAAESK